MSGKPTYEELEQRVKALEKESFERKRTEEDLNLQKRRLESLIEYSSLAIVTLDERHNIISCNRDFEKLFYFSESEMVGINLDELIAGQEYIEDAISYTKETLRGKAIHGSGKRQRKDGAYIDIDFIGVPVIIDGKVIGAYGIYRDISERKQADEERKKLEAQLRQAQKMEAIGTLAGGIAHDFNNILAAIIGYAEIATLQVGEDTKLKDNLGEVLKAGRRARDLVKQILAFSRQNEQERMPLQMRSIVKEAIKLLRASLPTTIEIRQNIESDLATVEADPTQIHQVLMNLCTNAHHAMSEEGGVLEVNLQNVSIGDWGLGISEFEDEEKQSAIRIPQSEIDLSPGKYVRLTVSDTGHGMTPDIKQRIFDPYFTTKEKGRGTGMGLAVVHGIVKSHGGAITVYSEPGKCSTFHVYIPAINVGVVEEKDEIEPLPTGHERILFIDDEPALADIGRQMLERLGYEVDTRTSSLEALELFKSQHDRIDLVITDMTMPNMTGDRLARELMQIRPDIPIILCTGYSERITEGKAKGIGIKAFAMKPLVMRDLADTVRKALD